MNKILFCNIGWMLEYRGVTDSDAIVNGGEYVAIEKNGGEVCNFLQHRGHCFGYVQPTGGQTIHIKRLGAEKDAQSISGVDVVFTAKRPGVGRVIVGWYKNATVHKHLQTIEKPSRQHVENRVVGFRISTKQKYAYLIQPEERNFSIPDARHGGMGHSAVWYAEHANAAWMAKVRAYIKSGKVVRSQKTLSKRKGKYAQDQDLKARVEKSAIDAVASMYKSKGYTVRSVEAEKCGWDLVAESGNATLRLEVKGTSGLEVSAQLTPNEYGAMKKHRKTYSVCVVTDALRKPKIHVFSYNFALDEWAYIKNGKPLILKVRPVVGAVLSCG